MLRVRRHLVRATLAGLVALLPIGGLVFVFAHLEGALRPLVKALPFYFPGLGILTALLGCYVLGVVISTVLGRALLGLMDRMLAALPVLGLAYDTLKQILGFGSGRGALFQRVVFVSTGDQTAELGLVTAEIEGTDGAELAVFMPDACNPTVGRLRLVKNSVCRPAGIEVDAAFRALVTAGNTLGARA